MTAIQENTSVGNPENVHGPWAIRQERNGFSRPFSRTQTLPAIVNVYNGRVACSGNICNARYYTSTEMRKTAFISNKRFEEMVEINSPDLVTHTKETN